MTSFEENAHDHAARGWPVFPCSPETKRPLVRDWPNVATTDPATISAWAKQFPTAMVGMVTGQRSGMIAIDTDLDPARGLDGEATLLELGELPDTPTVKTPRGGHHRYFRYDTKRPIRNSTSQLGPGIDVRGDGGYVIAAGSSNSKGQRYEWHFPISLFEIAEAPDWLYLALQKRTQLNHPHCFNELPTNVVEESHPDDIRRALYHYWDAGSYDDWTTAALALHSFPSGKELWLDWAQTSSKFDRAENERKWEDTEPSRGITVRSLFDRIPRDVLSSWGKGRWSNLKSISTSTNSIQNSNFFLDSPTPLYRARTEAPEYPVASLGATLQAAAEAIIDVTQCPPAIAAQSVLGAASLAVQGHADVVIPATLQNRPLSLFLVTVAPSGERKSAVDREALRGVRAKETDLRTQFEIENNAYQLDKFAWEAIRNLAKKAGKGDFHAIKAAIEKLGPEPRRPLAPILICGEPTLEGLHKLYPIGQPSLGIFSDEGGTFINGHGMSVENRLRTGAGLSDFWDGATITRVRSLDGSSVLAGRRLAIHLMAQPDAAAQLLSNPILWDQGLLARILVAAPTGTAGTRFQREPKAHSRLDIAQFSKKITSILDESLPIADGTQNELQPRRLELEDTAIAEWEHFANHVETLLGESGPLRPIGGFAGKMAEHAARIAGVLELVENIHAEAISVDNLRRAIALVEFYAGETLRLFEAGAVRPELQRAEALRSWLLQKWPNALISTRDIVQRGPNQIRDTATAKEAVNILAEHGWLRGPLQGVVDGRQTRGCWEIIRGAQK